MSFTGFNLSNISSAYVGNTPVQQIYYGSNLLWPSHDYSQDYLTFEALEPTTFTFTENALQYSLDNGSTWTTLTANTASPQLATGDKIMWKQTGLTPVSGVGIGKFSATGNFKAYGNIMSLYYGDNFVGETDLTGKNRAFVGLFYTNTYLIDASNLILPATILAQSCYNAMLYGCTSLTDAPELPATILAQACYYEMFCGCSSLTTAPELPATTLTNSCYYYMFKDCTSLKAAPELSATTLANSCYQSMFSGCTSLTTAPALPATTLSTRCYNSMFYNCTSLTAAPELPATTLAEYCYSTMFMNCRALTDAPTTLPATTLANSCYDEMFYNCKSLTTAPELPATTLAKSCYISMFSGCTSLNYIKCLATDITESYCTDDWVYNVAASGTFVKDASMSSWTTGNNGIPSGWVQINN